MFFGNAYEQPAVQHGSRQVRAGSVIKSRRSPHPTAPCLLRNGGFYKGRRLIRLPAIGLPLGMPASARYEPPRGFPCQIRRGPGRLGVEPRPASELRFFAPADRRQAPPLRERQRELRRARRVGGACGPAGRLETVQKAHTGSGWQKRLARPSSVGTFGTCAEGVELVEILPGACRAGVPLVQEFGEVTACCSACPAGY